MYRFHNKELQVLLVHPGGPFFKNKDAGSWSIPKGEFESGEEPLTAAIREFTEELGTTPTGNFIPLSTIVQKGGKTVFAWMVEGNLNPADFTCNTFSMEWPPRSGKQQDFPEIDKAEWFTVCDAKKKMLVSQIPLLEEAEKKLA